MILLLYRLLIIILYGILKIISIFSKSLKEAFKKRKLNIPINISIQNKTVYWLHGASVGELDQCIALTKVILEKDKNAFIMQSVYSDSVTKEQLDKTQAGYTFYLPPDIYGAYNSIFQKFKPKYLLIAAWDTWPELILKAKKEGTYIFLFSATLSKDSGRYKNWFARKLSQKILSQLDGISSTYIGYNDTFQELIGDTVKIETCGDSRFDSVIQKIEGNDNSKLLPLEKLTKRRVLILGSTYTECEDIWFSVLTDIIVKGYDVWIFPHKVEPDRLNEISVKLKQLNLNCQLYSQINIDTYNPIIVFDQLGILAFAYRYSDIVYVGGAIHNRVHNVIEPAYFGNLILTGPKIKNASEAILMQKCKGLFTIRTTEDIISILNQIETDDILIKEVKKKNSEFVIGNRGSSERFYNEFLSKV